MLNRIHASPAARQDLDRLFQLQQIAPDLAWMSQLEAQPQVLKHMLSWTVLRPLVISAYQSALRPEDVEALLAFYKTPAGKLYVTKLLPASDAAGRAIEHHFDERLRVVLDTADSVSTDTLYQRKAWVAANPKERAAGELASFLIEGRFDERLHQLENKILAGLNALLPNMEVQSAKEQAVRYAKLIRNGLPFDGFKSIVVQELLAALSLAEMQILLASEITAERRLLRVRLRLADLLLQEILQGWLKTTLMPALREFLAGQA